MFVNATYNNIIPIIYYIILYTIIPIIMFFLPLIMSSTKVDSSFLGIYKFVSRSVCTLLSIFLLIYNEVPPLVHQSDNTCS